MAIEKKTPLESAIENGYHVSIPGQPFNLKALDFDYRNFVRAPINPAETFRKVRNADFRVKAVSISDESFYPSTPWLDSETNRASSLVDILHPAFRAQLIQELGNDQKVLEAFTTLEKTLTHFNHPDFNHMLTAFSDRLVRNLSTGVKSIYNENTIITEPTILQAFLTTLPGENRSIFEKITTLYQDLHQLVSRRPIIEQSKYLVDTQLPYTALLGQFGYPQAIYRQIDELLKSSSLPKPILEVVITAINQEAVEFYLEAHRKHTSHLIKAHGNEINHLMEDWRGVSLEAAELDGYVLERMKPDLFMYDSKEERKIPIVERFQQANADLIHPMISSPIKKKLEEISNRLLEIVPPFPKAYDENGLPAPERTYHPILHFPPGFHDSADMVTASTIELVKNQVDKTRKSASLLTFQNPITNQQAEFILHLIQPENETTAKETQQVTLFEMLKNSSASAIESIAFITSLLSEFKAVQKREKIKGISLLPKHIDTDLITDLEIYRDLCFVVYTQKNLAIMKKIIDTTKISRDSDLDKKLKEYLHGMVSVITIEKPA